MNMATSTRAFAGASTCYVDHTKPAKHPYRVDHMNAHIETAECRAAGEDIVKTINATNAGTARGFAVPIHKLAHRVFVFVCYSGGLMIRRSVCDADGLKGEKAWAKAHAREYGRVMVRVDTITLHGLHRSEHVEYGAPKRALRR